MPYALRFYQAASGEEPALDYIRAQIKSHRAKIGRALRYLEETGHLARRPLVDYVGGGLYELRPIVEGHQHRLLYFFHGQTIIVVTSGFLKNMKRIHAAELIRAQDRRHDWISRFGGRS